MSGWDGKVVMSTPGGPIVEMSLGDLLARKDAEIERQRAEIERLRADRRERIATAALQGILACQEGNTALPKEWPGIFAIMSVGCADALIAKLDEEKGRP